MTARPSISLIYLMYNEEANIAAALDEGLAYCRADLDEWEIVVVDDGSRDGGAAIVERYAAAEPRVRLVRREKNGGMGAAMASGLRAATCDFFTFLPSDLQIEAIELRKMVPLLAGGDIILSIYEKRPSGLKRSIMSRVFRDYLMVVAHVHFQLEGLYLFPTKLGQELLPQVQGDTFFFSFQLIQMAQERGYRTVQTTIQGKPRVAGESKVVAPRKILKVCREAWDYRVRRGF